MVDVRVIGLDIAKSVFQLHGLDDAGATVLQKRLTRARMLPFFEKLAPCLVGIEACATSHYWARELTRLGHEVKLMPAQYVKPYVKRQKNDMADAEAIAEAVTRPNMRFVAAKTAGEQSAMMLHKVRLMLNRQLVMLSNAIRAHMAEFGTIAPVGRIGTDRLLAVIDDETDERVPAEARSCLQMLAAQLTFVKRQILENDRQVLSLARSSELGRRLMDIPGTSDEPSHSLHWNEAGTFKFRLVEGMGDRGNEVGSKSVGGEPGRSDCGFVFRESPREQPPPRHGARRERGQAGTRDVGSRDGNLGLESRD